jgi:putative colanic acid biosynthesis acetyltransferase WcaF
MNQKAEAYGIKASTDGHTAASFPVSHRLRRVVWNLVYTIFFRTSPRPLHAWRATLLRSFGASVGKGVHVYPKAIIWAPWNLDLAEDCAIADGVNCYSMAKITVGKRAIVSQGAHLCTGTHDYSDPNFQLLAFPITIGEYAWICTEAFIGPGVTVGNGTVVGARSVAVKSLPDGMVCAGQPCKPIKPRYTQKPDDLA